MCMQWWTGEGTRERNSLKPFLLILLPAFAASSGIALLTEEQLWRRQRVTHSQGAYLQVLFSKDQCVGPGEERFQFCLENLDQTLLTMQTSLPSRD